MREKTHIFYCKENYHFHTFLKSTKESPPKIKMHYLPKDNAVIQPEITRCKNPRLKSLQTQSQMRSTRSIQVALTSKMQRKATLSRKQSPAFLLEPTFSPDKHLRRSPCQLLKSLSPAAWALHLTVLQSSSRAASNGQLMLLVKHFWPQNTTFLLHLTLLRYTSKSAWRKYCFTDFCKINLFLISHAVSFPGTQS